MNLQNRISDMKDLREKNWTLQEIANKYTMSRERVRQLIGNTGRSFRVNNAKNLVTTNETQDMAMSERLATEITGLSKRTLLEKGVLKKTHRKINTESSVKVGVDAEEAVSENLLSMGIKNKLMPFGHPYDILLENGRKIEVKYCSKKSFPPTQPGGWYRFNIGLDRKYGEADFYICVMGDLGDAFVIPRFFLRNSRTLSICWPEKRNTHKSKFSDFLNAYESIR